MKKTNFTTDQHSAEFRTIEYEPFSQTVHLMQYFLFIQIEELTSQQKETIDNHDGEINTLNNTVKAQQAEYESQIKLNSETFTKVQDELQRMLTEKETKLDQVWLHYFNMSIYL